MTFKISDWTNGGEGRVIKRLLWKVEMVYNRKHVEVLGWQDGCTMWVGHKDAQGKKVETSFCVDTFEQVAYFVRAVVVSEQLRLKREELAEQHRRDARGIPSNVLKFPTRRKSTLR
jgi:hypothetical protein